jgi:dGTPase
VDKADELAYSAHDVDDGLSSGLITVDDLRALSIWDNESGPFRSSDAGQYDPDGDLFRRKLARYLINRMATDLLEATSARLNEYGVTDFVSLRRTPRPVCGYSTTIEPQVAELKQVLRTRLYHHPRLLLMADQAHRVIRRLFDKLTSDPQLMPPRFRTMLRDQPVEIVVADYIAGMTDRFAERLAEQQT